MADEVGVIMVPREESVIYVRKTLRMNNSQRPQETSNWILADGTWNDSGLWDDAAVWID